MSASTPPPTAPQSAEQVADIQSIQRSEKDLLDTLETNTHLTDDQRNDLVDKINALSNMRINLYKTLQNASAMYQTNLTSSTATMTDQHAAITVEEKNLNEFKHRLKALQNKNIQTTRLIEINHYYSEHYKESSTIMMMLVAYFAGLILIHFLYKAGIMPNAIYWALVIVLSAVIAYQFWGTLLLFFRRNNMDYDQLNFRVPAASDVPAATVSGSGNDPWYMPKIACIGEACCTSGMVFDSTQNICVVSAANDSATGATTTESTPATV